LNKPYKQHCEQLIYDQELALLPATQVIVEQLMEQERIAKELIAVKLQIRKLYARRDMLENQRNNIRANMGTEDRIVTTFTRACPDPDCRGFLSTQWKCGLCNKWTCPECNEVKGVQRDSPHECHPDQVASTALMRDDTKPCPNCGIGIFRISGCSQLWCTQCHTAFCWNTGQIETRIIHNPHYFEWMRRQPGTGVPRDPGDIPCGRELDIRFVNQLEHQLKRHSVPETLNKRVIGRVRKTIHLLHVDIPQYRTNRIADNRKLRIRYLRNYITDDQFKTMLHKSHKKHCKHREILDILQMMVLTCTDVLRRLYAELYGADPTDRFDCIGTEDDDSVSPIIDMEAESQSSKTCLAHLDEIRQLIEYANGCLQGVGTNYGCVALKLSPSLSLERS
jgi:hypothetical protein